VVNHSPLPKTRILERTGAQSVGGKKRELVFVVFEDRDRFMASDGKTSTYGLNWNLDGGGHFPDHAFLLVLPISAR